MPLSFDDWKSRLKARWQRWTANPKAALTNTGSGAIGIDDAVVAGESGVAVRGDVHGGVHITHVTTPPAPHEKPRLSEAEQLADYLNRVMAENNVLRLGGISSDASDPQRRLAEAKNPGALSEVFISLRVDRFRGEPGEHDQTDPRAVALEREREQLTALEALSDAQAARAVLLGLPGAGKSTVLRYLAFRLAEAYAAPPALKESLPEWKAGALLPVVVSLARLADALPDQPERGLDGRVVRFIEDDVESIAGLEGFGARVWREARARGVLFLFDGLDEVAPGKRAVVKAALLAFLGPRPRCRAVVTCRTFSYGDEAWRLEGWPPFQLAPLEADAQRAFIGKWYAALTRNDPASGSLYAKKAEGLERAIFSGDARRLQHISDNPLLLTLIAIVHTHREELPRSRVRIYEECVSLLLLRWQTRRTPYAPLHSVIEAMSAVAPDKAGNLEGLLLRGLYDVAFHAREGQGLRQGDSTLIDLRALRHALLPKLGEAATAEFIRYCQTANGLLLAHGSRRLPDRPADEEPVECFAFPHPSFEEYLAARYIATLEQPHAELAQRNAASDRWFYVGVFLAEYSSIVSQRPRDVLELMEDLLSVKHAGPDAGEGYWRNVWLAGGVWPIFCAEFPERNDATIQTRVVEQLTALITTGKLPPPERAQAGRALAALGDPRDFDALASVPAGKFWLGDEKGSPTFTDNHPPHEVYLPDYRIGKYPVTVRQWRRFVEATQYEGHARALEDPANHPVTVISWRDAQAYCKWLTGEWRKFGKIGADEVVRLPSEAEWEKAARGGDKRAWPWGNEFDPDKANSSESGIGNTSAVGSFPAGESPYGCLDLAGNAWGWCQSKRASYPYRADDGREDLRGNDSRVLRGGAWSYLSRSARCAFRFDAHPDGRDGDIGFRVVVSPGSRR
ncbi:MAG TPA: SUMF1/EgtB/PvdO family nonheme iron enzyme [Anaerolineae bacterium]|nr:SUMF1/EgtB/PvdO family nonheme iron enzyme [Anaerolineae bacterium]